jgi:4-alpha-glucanotransferase
MAFARAGGILLHPTSLPSRGGIGDLGPAAYEFADFLAAAKQALWQVLPLGPLGYGHSPYSSTSAFAGNPLLISLERLADHGWLDRGQIAELPATVSGVDYDVLFRRKMPLLFEAARNFVKSATGNARNRFEQFCSENAWWLDQFVLFDALHARHGRESWNRWPSEFMHRKAEALGRVREELSEELKIRRAVQFAFWEQWSALRHYCAGRAVRMVGDIAIFLNFDSADVWTNPELFFLDEELAPTFVAGVPPDFFSKTGQRWGSPLYRWEVMKRDGFHWWVARMRWAVRTCDYVRLDHFRAFEQYWEIPAAEETAINGRWVDGPRDELFVALREALGGLPFFAEDLGYITPEVHALRERFGIPGMAVMQFGFGDRGAHIYLPHMFTRDRVVYTGTHDNDTIVGWWTGGASKKEREYATSYLGKADDGIHWAMIRAAYSSVASLCVVPLQDVLGLGSEARMNVPSVNNGNWRWRFQPQMLTDQLAQKLADLADVSDRLPAPIETAPAPDFAA